MARLYKRGAMIAAIVTSVLLVNDAQAGTWEEIKALSWEDGRNRLEVQGWAGMRSGRRSRSGDGGIVGSYEREFVVGEKLTVGARLIPVFFYAADAEPGDNYPETDVAGFGFGLTIRRYLHEAEDGWYAELAESVIAHEEKFNGNSGSVNFMTELAIGYEFASDFHVSGRWRHLSNAGLADDNSGVNAFGISIGFSF